MPIINFRLYLVTDRRQVPHGSLLPVLAEFIAAGGPAIQLREKDLETRDILRLARAIKQAARRGTTKLFINDRADVAIVAQADGLHLRESSLPVPAARGLLGADGLLGVSIHSVEGAVRAEAEGADFVVLGPIYDTPSKRAYGAPLGLHVLEQACRQARIPVFAIGGITAERAREVRQSGAFGVAVISSILCAADVARATHELLDAVNRPEM